MYPEHNQIDPDKPNCAEDSAYPANPDSEYGWEKLFSERLFMAFARNYHFRVRVGRYHNIFGPLGTWEGGREKAPAAICRKVIMSKDGQIEIWGDGRQTRSFLYIDECLDGTLKLMRSKTSEPLNIGSDEMVTINKLVEIVVKISSKTISVKHIDGPVGVRGRNSDNTKVRSLLGWEPSQPLESGVSKTYSWISDQIKKMHT